MSGLLLCVVYWPFKTWPVIIIIKSEILMLSTPSFMSLLLYLMCCTNNRACHNLIGKSLKETFTKWVYDAVFYISIWHFYCSMPFMSLTIHILCWYDQYNCHSVKWRFFEQPSMFSIQQNYSYFIFFNDSHSCFHEIYIDEGWTYTPYNKIDKNTSQVPRFLKNVYFILMYYGNEIYENRVSQ